MIVTNLFIFLTNKNFFYKIFINMKIYNTQNYKPAFGAIKIAEAKNYLKGIKIPISIYKITPNDRDFLEYLQNSVNLKELKSDLPENMLYIWQEIFKIALTEAKNSSVTTLLGVFKNKPCAIMNFVNIDSKYRVKTVCSWPVEPDKKVPYAGKTLFMALFQKFLNNNGQHIDLDAITNGPFNAVGKYSSRGFKQRGGENYIVAMRADNNAITNTVHKLGEFIKILPVSENKEVNLLQKLI